MKRGEVWWVNFGPSVGGEIRKRRPAIVISNDLSNKFLNRVQVVPLTSNTGKCYPSEALVTVKRRQSKAMADQIMTVSKMRLINLEGKISAPDLRKVQDAILIQLGMQFS